jgi:hypothetical protein
MIYLNAQPDDYYFTWQIELQLLNFSKLGIRPEDIHVLIGYHPQRGVRDYFQELIAGNSQATFFTYPDNRISKSYPSSIRPHIIKQHIQAHPELRNTPVFYCDSDILLREIPAFSSMLADDYWYVSDTRHYLDLDYIKRCGSEALFVDMCAVVDIPPETVIQNNEQVGGAQYLLKNTTYEFWDKVERDCEALYALLNDFNCRLGEAEYIKNGKKKTEYGGIQAWCTDMWVVLWNAWLAGHKTLIHPELDFCWTKNNLTEWHKKKILHYSGVMPQKNNPFFRKSKYTLADPFDENFDDIDKDSCSMPVIELIGEYVKIREKNRIDLTDVTFLIPVRIDSEGRLQNLLMVIAYLHKHFDTHIIVAESDGTSRVPVHRLPSCCRYFFIQDDDPKLHRTRLNNRLIKQSDTAIVALYDTDAVLAPEQIKAAVETIRNGNAHYASPYNGEFLDVDKMLKGLFGRVLDAGILQCNKNKLMVVTKRSWGGACFLLKEAYIEAGMENERFLSWGPDDIERVKRLEILGYTIRRVEGPLFHLNHERKENSGYQDHDVYCTYMQIYFDLCSMTKEQLCAHVAEWKWSENLNEVI